MRLDHPDYIKLVIAAYHDKRLNNQLSPLLAQPTPAGIRQECATVYQERFDKKDEPMLRSFFGPAEQGRRFQALIESFEADRFRPLDSFLKEENKKGFLKEEGKKGITNRNLELLAWLIDFKYRPFVFSMEVFLTDKERKVLGIESTVSNPGKEEEESKVKQGPNSTGEPATTLEGGNIEVKNTSQTEDDKPQVVIVTDTEDAGVKDERGSVQNIKWKKPAAIGLLSVIVSGAIYLGSQNLVPPVTPLQGTNTGCMYWTGDHYEKVPCDTIIKDGLKLSFDEKLENLRRITRLDTISEWSIGKVHYIKDSGIKFYTESGFYPEEPSRPLKKLTRYIFDKYLRNKKDSGKYASAEINKSQL